MIIYADNEQKFRHENYPPPIIPEELKGITWQEYQNTKNKGLKTMAKIDITPHIPLFEEAVKDLISPPFRIWEPFTVLSVCGDIIREAEPLATKEEYKEALEEVWAYLDGKYKVVEQVDKAIKAGIFEMFDGTLFRLSVEQVAIPQLAELLATKVG